MRLEQARELYSDYAEGALSPALRLAMEQHFEAASEARADYAEFARIYALMETLEAEPLEAPLGFRARVLERVSAEQARREAVPSLGLTGWFRGLGTRRATGGVLAALAACGVAGILLAPQFKTSSQQGTLGPVIPAIASPVALPTTITGVTQSQDAAGSHYNFQIHLPATVPSATVSAFVLTDPAQITDADARAAQATSALTPPMTLTNDESVEIPVTFQHPAPAGTTRDLLVQWAPGGGQPSNSQVIFVPSQPGASPAKPLPAQADFYDALQSVAAEYGVTVIADAGAAPTQSVTPPTGANAQDELQSVAAQVGDTVQALPNGVYQVSVKPAQPTQ